MAIIGLSGKRGSGKDTLAAQMFPYGWHRLSFADDLKERCRADFGLTADQTDGVFKEAPTQYHRSLDRGFYTPRDIMIRCGFFYRDIDPMFWVRQVYKHVADYPYHDRWVITDVRFKNEANYIREHGGFLVRLERDPALSIYKGSVDDPSETELDDYEFDYKVPAYSNLDVSNLRNVAKELEARYGSR